MNINDQAKLWRREANSQFGRWLGVLVFLLYFFVWVFAALYAYELFLKPENEFRRPPSLDFEELRSRYVQKLYWLVLLPLFVEFLAIGLLVRPWMPGRSIVRPVICFLICTFLALFWVLPVALTGPAYRVWHGLWLFYFGTSWLFFDLFLWTWHRAEPDQHPNGCSDGNKNGQ